MKRFLILLLVFAVAATFPGCGCSAQQIASAPADTTSVESVSAPTWQDQYDLGLRYLSEGNYQEAILAFEMAIAIDPKRPEAYAKAAEVHELVGDSAAAVAVLERGLIATGDEALNPIVESPPQTSQDDVQSEDAPSSNLIEITTAETITTYGIIERNDGAFPDYRLHLKVEHTIALDDPYVGKEVFECEYLYFYNDADLNGGFHFEELAGKNCEVTALLEHYRGGGNLYLLHPEITVEEISSLVESDDMRNAIQLAPEELLTLLEGYWTLDDPNIPVDPSLSADLRYGGMEFFTIYQQDDMVSYGAGVWNSGRGRMGGIVSDVWQHEDTVYSFTVNFPEIPPSLMDPEGTPPTSYDVWIDLGAAGDNRLLMKPGNEEEYREHFYMQPPVNLW